MKKNTVKCVRFNNCEAPLCPLQPDTLKNNIWYKDEEICKNKECQKLGWIINQRKITRLASSDGFFTFNMLKNITRFRKGIEGLNSGLTTEQLNKEEKEWIEIRSRVSKKDRITRVSKNKNSV